MELNANFAVRVAVHAATLPWQKSPMPGVERRMLDRLGDEVARATSIVRYAPGSSFSSHVHTGGEEFFVLSGVFQDEHGDFPEGSYIRNPPQTSHTPASGPGCTIFVKLWQFGPDDRTEIAIETANMEFIPDETRPGIEVMPLFHDSREDVCLEKWKSGTEIELAAPNGLEILVLDGSFREEGEKFEPQSWLRLPKDGSSRAVAGEHGTKVWIKRGHLAQEPTYPKPDGSL